MERVGAEKNKIKFGNSLKNKNRKAWESCAKLNRLPVIEAVQNSLPWEYKSHHRIFQLFPHLLYYSTDHDGNNHILPILFFFLTNTFNFVRRLVSGWINILVLARQGRFSLWAVYMYLGKQAWRAWSHLKFLLLVVGGSCQSCAKQGLGAGIVSPWIRTSTQNHFWTILPVAPQLAFSQDPSQP